MKAFIVASLLFVAVSATLDATLLRSQFEAFKVKHNKSYVNQVEETTRYTIFAQNVEEIESHNARFDQGLETYKKGINQFADWTQEEFKSYLTLHPKPTIDRTNAIGYVKKGIQVPESVDWRTEGYVTAVKDQGNCGSCWSFSVTGTVEGAYKKKSGQLISLSEQQLVDCSTDVNYGCDGGYMVETLPYVKQHGLETEADYPYTAIDGSCKFESSKVVTKIDDYVWFDDEESLLEATATEGPISIAMDASYINFYSSGIYSDSRCSSNPDDMNHGVLIVGYGSQNGQDYWIVKNSWGVDFGEDGYIKMVRGINQCGVAVDDTYPIIN